MKQYSFKRCNVQNNISTFCQAVDQRLQQITKRYYYIHVTEIMWYLQIAMKVRFADSFVIFKNMIVYCHIMYGTDVINCQFLFSFFFKFPDNQS